ncbi:MAG: TIGR00730 family Rossman fold protein [Ignavibacteria bacterium]|nr:TIGR00730 family Rossman fold protein [Ignavibacteria bacterium]
MPIKAYKNLEFLNSPDARVIRIIAEFLEPQSRFKKLNIQDTIVFFGSARIVDRKTAQKMYNDVKKLDPKREKNFAEKLRKAQVALEMSKYYEEAVQLSKMLTEWSLSLPSESRRFVVCTGGGPGIMEAANKGARLGKGKTIGLNISIPNEQFVNKYVNEELSFEFHYFFMRKFWLIYLAKALVIFPGGYGTLDELMEVLTLIQTGKISKKILVIIYGTSYWKKVINFDAMIEHGCIDKKDTQIFTYCDTPEQAFNELKNFLTKNYL